MSAQLAIQQAIVAALAASPAVAGGRVWANRLRPLAAGQDTGVVVRLSLSRAQPVQQLSGPMDWQTVYAVECVARGTAPAQDPAQAVDALLAASWSRLSALSLDALGVIDLRVQPAIDWDYDEAETVLARAAISVQVWHRTAGDSLAPWS